MERAGTSLNPDEHAIVFLARQHARLDGDIFEIGPDTWAIHGAIAFDGQVLLAAFSRRDEAQRVLDRLPPDPIGPT